MKLQISLSAIPLSTVKSYMRETPFQRQRYEEIFKHYGSGKAKRYRIYVPLSEAKHIRTHVVHVPEQIESYITSIGMTVDNYLAGTAIMADGKRTTRLGKVLAKKPDLLRVFENDPQRKLIRHEKGWVVISRHPYDVLGMSFDRGWTSCMNLEDGINRHYLDADLKLGTIVAYLIKDTDKNINAPTARIALRPYFKDDKFILIPSGTYGTASSAFTDIVRQFCTYVNEKAPAGRYEIPDSLYDDGTGYSHMHLHGTDISTLSDDECSELAEQGYVEPEVLEALVKRGDADLIADVVRRHTSRLSPETLLQIALDPKAERAHRLMLRRIESLPLKVVMYYASMDDEEIQVAVADSCELPSVLGILSGSKYSYVRSQVARNSYVPVEALLKLAGDSDASVAAAAIRNRRTSFEMIKTIVEKNSSEVIVKAALYRDDLPVEFLTQLIENNLNFASACEEAANLHDLPPELYMKVYEKTVSMSDDEEWDAPGILDDLARNPSISLDLIYKLATIKDASVAAALLRRRDQPKDLLDILLRSNPKSLKVAHAVLNQGEGEITTDQLKLLLSSENESIVEMVFDHDLVTLELEDFFMQNASENMLETVMSELRYSAYKRLFEHVASNSTSVKVLKALVDYNSSTYPESYIELLLNNKAVYNPEVLYPLYARLEQDMLPTFRERFAPHLEAINHYAEEDGRYNVADLDASRLRRYERSRIPKPAKKVAKPRGGPIARRLS